MITSTITMYVCKYVYIHVYAEVRAQLHVSKVYMNTFRLKQMTSKLAEIASSISLRKSRNRCVNQLQEMRQIT